jgi:excisionase family DNA binding protein
MQAVTITQITPPELETLIENSIIKVLSCQRLEPQTETDRWLDLNELCIYHPDKPTKPTVYGWVHSGLIPCHKGAKKLRFLKSEIDQWLSEGRLRTVKEINSEAHLSLKKKRGQRYD